MGAEIDLFLEPRLWISKLISKLETGNWIHEKNKIRASMTSVVTSIHNFKQESLFRIKACRGVAFCEAGSSLAPLHLSRTLYKSPLFMQNKPNFQDVQMNVTILLIMAYENFIPLAGYKNKPNSNPIRQACVVCEGVAGLIKPNCRKGEIDTKCVFTKDYRKKDDFAVRINKPNFFKCQNERKPNFNKGLQKKRTFSPQKTNPIQTQSVRPALFAKELPD